MTFLEAIISGVVQGVTEFLPVSSSGHLAILHNLIGLKKPQLAFDIFLHMGTLTAIFIVFRKDVIDTFTVNKKTGIFIYRFLFNFSFFILFYYSFYYINLILDNEPHIPGWVCHTLVDDLGRSVEVRLSEGPGHNPIGIACS